MTAAEALPDDTDMLKAMLLAERAEITSAQPSAIGLAAKVYLFLHLDFFNYLAHDSAAIAPGKLFQGGWHPAGDLAFATAMLRDAVNVSARTRAAGGAGSSRGEGWGGAAMTADI